MAEERKLVKKLAHVMQQVQYIQKRGKNKFHGYTYATEADVNEKVREELSKQNVIMLPSMKNHSIRETTTKSGNREYIACVDMEFKFVDGETGEELAVQMSGEGQDVGDKAIYKAISGAQKYALMKVFMIPTGDDPEADTPGDDRNNGGTKPTQNQSKPQVTGLATTPQKNMVTTVLKKIGMSKDEFREILRGLHIENYSEMSQEQAVKLLDTLNTYPPKEEAN